ncbi:MAG: hypothetical protein L6Q37_12825 [Bdellovibrionaceae bacterium]|nr:hypothetical protein [Pseudobdellovibrionaceae bacterium]
MVNLKISKWTKFFSHKFKVVTLLGLSIGLFIGCQKSNTNSTVAAPILPINSLVTAGNCVQCNFAQVQLVQATSQGTNSFPVTINWQLIGEQVKIQQILAMGWNPQKTYSGLVYARGAMTISSSQASYYNVNGILAGQCQIPAGQYTINPLQPGNMSYGSFELPQFEAIQGAVRIIFQLGNAIIEDPNGDGQVDRIAGMLVPVQMIYNGATVACGDIGVYIQ